jgi:superfamily II DNA or RNA helicase
MLTRSGYIVKKGPEANEHKKKLTVRPVVKGDYGVAPPSFKVFKQSKQNVCIPRYYGQEHFGLNVPDRRPEPSPASFDFEGSLRDSTRQNEAFSAAIDAMNTRGGGILSLPCGYGKTTVALAIAAHMKVRTMVVVHKEFLANQWKERIAQFCPAATIGTIQQDKVETSCDISIAMLQSLSMRDYPVDTFETFGMVIVDEAHHICAKVFSQAFFRFCPKYTLGLSATPERKDGLTDVLYWFLGPNILTIERELRGRTIVKTIDFKCDHFASPPPVTRFGKVSLVQMITDLVEMYERNQFILKIARKYSKGSRRLLILSDRRWHCEFLHDSLKDLGCGLYMGGMKEAQLQESSKQKIIVGTFSQAHEGLDIPELDTILLATPKSDVKQAVGRILRETKGKKNEPIILDFRDHWGMLTSMYYKRRKMYKESGFELDKIKDFEEPAPTILDTFAFRS